MKLLLASTLPDYNKLMTVGQMTDLVTFLHAHYTKFVPEYTEYGAYPDYGP